MMNEAKSRFFANFEREMAAGDDDDDDDEEDYKYTKTKSPSATAAPLSKAKTNNSKKKSPNLDIDFSVTESGRTVAHMVTETNRSTMHDDDDDDDDDDNDNKGDDDDLLMDFSITQSARSAGTLEFTESERGVLVDAVFGTAQQSNRSLASINFTESERGVFLEAFGPQSTSVQTTGGRNAATTTTSGQNSRSNNNNNNNNSSNSGRDKEFAMELTESDRGVLLEAFGPEESSSTLDRQDDDDENDVQEQQNNHHLSLLKSDKNNMSHSNSKPSRSSDLPAMVGMGDEKKTDAATNGGGRTIPVPRPGEYSSSSQLHHFNYQQQHQQQPSQNSSYGSSGSAFLSSVLNPHASGMHQPSPHGVSHTPPIASSFEVAHFGKRPRAGSVSGKLRSASDYLEEKGLLDRQTKGLLNDLLIMGDEEMQRALDRYEDAGDPSLLEEMIRSGALQHRLPQDLDILGELDFDFLTVHDSNSNNNNNGQNSHYSGNQMGQQLPQQPQHSPSRPRSQPIPMQQQPHHQHRLTSHSATPSPQTSNHHSHPYGAPPSYGDGDDDGIGELDFAGDFVSDQTHFNLHHHLNNSNHHHQQYPQHHQYSNGMAHHHPHQQNHQGSYASSSQDHQIVASPAEIQQMTEYERRSRSNSLFSALLNDPRQHPQLPHPLNYQYSAGAGGGIDGGPQSHGSASSAARQYEQWMMQQQQHQHPGTGAAPPASPHEQATRHHSHPGAQNTPPGIHIAGRKPSMAKSASGLTTSLEAEKKKKEKEKRDQKKTDSSNKKKQQQQQQSPTKKKDRKSSQQQQHDDDSDEHVTGCGRPRSPSDPSYFKTSKDSHGLMKVERPDGWVGAYSPESRKARLERFMEKRKHRVWTQGVKYDVRKNFAESRLRVKGRFVKKEDELMMRELMSIT
ncbi:hypothetical protein ACA910_013978 [Epithemia clementina (nom. ined.)]